MKKTLLFLFTIIMFSVPLFSQQNFLFRGLPWGASKAEVIAKEGTKYSEQKYDENTLFVYENMYVASKPAKMIFVFSPNNTFTLAWYSFTIDTGGFLWSTKPFIDTYSYLCNMLTEIYGTPADGSQIIKSKGSDFDDWSEYHSKGDQSARWYKDGTEIKIELYPKEPKGRNIYADWSLSIFYTSPEYQQFAKEQNKKGL